MEVRQAVDVAKAYVRDLFAEEGVANLGLEEIRLNSAESAWLVTLGFSRTWQQSVSGLLPPARSYKVVEVSDGDGKVLSVTDRGTVAA